MLNFKKNSARRAQPVQFGYFQTDTTMKVKTLWSWEVGEKISGIVVVADVWAATTNLALFLGLGVKKLFLVDEKLAVKVKAKNPAAIMVGESHELPKDFFTVSNHAVDIAKHDWRGKTVYYMSTNGVRVMREMIDKGADVVVGLSLVNTEAVTKWLKQQHQGITLAAAGEATYADPRAPEDWAAVEWAERLLRGEGVNWGEEIKALK